MKQLIAQHELDIPEGVTLEVKGRRVRCKGPRGTFARSPMAWAILAVSGPSGFPSRMGGVIVTAGRAGAL